MSDGIRFEPLAPDLKANAASRNYLKYHLAIILFLPLTKKPSAKQLYWEFDC